MREWATSLARSSDGFGGCGPDDRQEEPRDVEHPLQGLLDGGGAEHHRGEAHGVLEPEELVGAGPAEVAVDEDDVVTGAGQAHGQVGHGGGLALTGGGAGDVDQAHVLADTGELQRGAQAPVGLGRGRSWGGRSTPGARSSRCATT